MRAIKRDTDADLTLGSARWIADGVCKGGGADFVWNEWKIYRFGCDEVVGATCPDVRDVSSAAAARGTMCDFGHHAVVFAIPSATGRHIHICRGRREERRDQRQHKQQ
jgi:hypothetical protein